MSKEIRARVGQVSYHPVHHETAITVYLPGELKAQRGELVTVTVNEGEVK